MTGSVSVPGLEVGEQGLAVGVDVDGGAGHARAGSTRWRRRRPAPQGRPGGDQAERGGDDAGVFMGVPELSKQVGR